MALAAENGNSLHGSTGCNTDLVAKEQPSPSNIRIYLRMRPMVGRCTWHSIVGKDDRTFITNLPRDERAALHNARATYSFRFDGIFNQEASQEDVFQGVALPVVDDALRGINGTIFAYGQTGTGKTYTITGDAEAFEMRGIIPRALARVFEFASSCSSAEFTLAISYLEIYQDRGYDLLVKTETAGNKLEDLKRVYAVTDDTGQIVLRGLSVNPVRTEEEALNLLFVGDANRIVAETPLNDCSTRSHCIFTIWIASKEHGSRSTKRAKLHLVDLAGSERVKQSGTRPGDCVFQEACSINLTLHYLEQVIVALHQKAAGQATHVPYRNSLMTSVLKDSLGGNCKTRMIATIALEQYAIQETINTCRFAQAVAQVRNVAAVNEEEEASALIERLTKENERLRGHLQLATQTQGEQLELTEEKQEMCKESVERFLRASGDDLELPLTAAQDLRSADFCFRIMREKFREATNGGCESGCMRRECRQSLQKLQLHVEQRDAEIATLLGILHQSSEPPGYYQTGHPLSSITRAAVEAAVKGPHHDSSSPETGSRWLTGQEATVLLRDRGRAFEILRRSARKAELLEADSQRLHRLYADVKAYGDAAVSARNKIAEARASLEKIRIRKCLRNSGEPQITDDETPEEANSLEQIAQWRDEYIKNIEAHDAAKRQLKRLHMSVDRSRKKLQDDFESWFHIVAARQLKRACGALTDTRQLGTCLEAPANAAQLQGPHQPFRRSHSPHIGHGPSAESASEPITPWVAHQADYPGATDSIACRTPSRSIPQGSSPPSHIPDGPGMLGQEQTGKNHIPPRNYRFTGEASCTHEYDRNTDEREKDQVESVASSQRSCLERVYLRCNEVSSAVPAINTHRDASEGPDNHTFKALPEELYTGNPSADDDIKAFYKALGTTKMAVAR